MFRYVLHGIASLLALGIVLGSAFYIAPVVLDQTKDAVVQISSTERSAIELEFTKKTNGASVILHNTGNAVVLVTLPNTLRIKEAYNTNMPLQYNTLDQASIEPSTGLRLEGPLEFTRLFVENVGNEPLFAAYTLIDLDTQDAIEDTALVVSERKRIW